MAFFQGVLQGFLGWFVWGWGRKEFCEDFSAFVLRAGGGEGGGVLQNLQSVFGFLGCVSCMLSCKGFPRGSSSCFGLRRVL